LREATNWRELLKQVISDSKERQRIAIELGVSPITLNRWASGESSPRPQNLRHLLSTLPARRQELEILLSQEYPELISSADNIPEEVPSEFYNRFLMDYTTLPKSLMHLVLTELVLRQILKQLDPNRFGMHIIVAKCMPPGAGNKVRSLFTIAQKSSADSDEHSPFFLGIESLGGHALMSGRPVINQDMMENSEVVSSSRDVYERSSVAYPITLSSNIAGCLILSSTQTSYFSTPRLSLVKSYVTLIALTFRDEDFYPQDSISLLQMPPYDIQKDVLDDFQNRIRNRLIEASREGEPLTTSEAELLVLKRIETELLQRDMLAEKLENQTNTGHSTYSRS